MSPLRGPAIDRLRRWGAEPTGETWTTPSSDLAAGVLGGVPVVAKVAYVEEERRGGRLLAWWSGSGGVPVLEADSDAILMRRATGPRDLGEWSSRGRDDDAVDAIVDTVAALHRMPQPPASVGLLPLRTWFRALIDRPQTDPLLDRAASVARALLDQPGPAVALHGDVHHGNVLDLDGRWAAIDPKALFGPPAFDLANLFCNPAPDLADARLAPRLERVADRARIDETELRAWILAWCGLSLAWNPDTGGHAAACRAVATRLSGSAGG